MLMLSSLLFFFVKSCNLSEVTLSPLFLHFVSFIFFKPTHLKVQTFNISLIIIGFLQIILYGGWFWIEQQPLASHFREAKEKFDQALLGTSSSPARWKHCLRKGKKIFKFAVGRMYVDEHFPEESKRKVNTRKGREPISAAALASQPAAGHNLCFIISIVFMTLAWGLLVGPAAESCSRIWLPCLSWYIVNFLFGTVQDFIQLNLLTLQKQNKTKKNNNNNNNNKREWLFVGHRKGYSVDNA